MKSISEVKSPGYRLLRLTLAGDSSADIKSLGLGVMESVCH
jgi:hypothetical protein